MKLLENNLFDLGGWYSKRRAKATCRGHPSRTGTRHIGYVLSEAAINILESGISSHYPTLDTSIDSGGRFGVYQSSRSVDIYEVTDADHQLVYDLPKEKLEDAEFNLIGWYLDQLEEGRLYNLQV